NMVSTIHNSSMVDVQRRHGQVKKPLCISEYNMFMKGVDRADQLLAYYSLPRKTVKWMKKVALWLINCAIFNSFTVFKKVNRNSTLKYKAFLLKLAKAWATDITVAAVPASDTDIVQSGPSVRTRQRPQVDPPGQLSGDMRKHILMKIVKSEYCKKKHPSRQCCVCAEHKMKSRTAYMCNLCVMPLHKGERFQRYHMRKHF
ncbi:hypothetical protein B7P43_G15595, partial [Cryptotermes secundus]